MRQKVFSIKNAPYTALVLLLKVQFSPLVWICCNANLSCFHLFIKSMHCFLDQKSWICTGMVL